MSKIMATEPPKRRRWFQFRLRTLLIGVLVLSLPLSWFGARLRQARKQREAVEAIERLGGSIFYERGTDSSAPKWIRQFVGAEFFVNVDGASLPLEFGDEEARYLKGLTGVEWLDLGGTQITDVGLEQLEGLTSLRSLGIWEMQVTDGGLAHLAGLRNLEKLYLFDTQITDAGLEHLKRLTKLQVLVLANTQATPEGAKKLQETLPNCRIDFQSPWSTGLFP